jgi:predicted sulfurtransferase
MKAKSRWSSFYAWLMGTPRESKAEVKGVEFCESCRLPLERLQSVFAPVSGKTYCRVCRAMIQAADRPYLKAVQEEYQEEQKRKKILMLGGNYLS